MKCQKQFEEVKEAARHLVKLTPDRITSVLLNLAEAAKANTDMILQENKRDLDRMDPNDPKYDRLMLTEKRIQDIANDIKNVATLPCPVGEIMEERTLDSGLKLKKVRVAMGVVGVIYEARPNVTFDVFALCFRSGNACVLKGGSDAEFSNKAITSIIKNVLNECSVDNKIIQLLPPDRYAADELMHANGYVDLLIPRGSQNLINSVREQSSIPVIETGAGIVHTYFDVSGDLEKGKNIVFNAKVRRPSVCNALDCLVIHSNRLEDLKTIVQPMTEKQVVIFADERSYEAIKGNYPDQLLNHTDENSFGTEFLSLKMSVKTVDSFDEALEHIYKYSSKHSEAIIAEDTVAIDRFLNEVDAAAVYANTSTAYTDGAQFGLGAEIGISTQKLHARGPMALRELTSYKWILIGEGQVRPA